MKLIRKIELARTVVLIIWFIVLLYCQTKICLKKGTMQNKVLYILRKGKIKVEWLSESLVI